MVNEKIEKYINKKIIVDVTKGKILTNQKYGTTTFYL